MLKSPLLTIFFFLLFDTNVFAQNLVLNPSFEDNDNCPSAPFGITFCTYWSTPTLGTPDYFNICATDGSVSIPQNNQGYQLAHSGNAYMGIFAYDALESREYIQGEIMDSLTKKKVYYVRFYVNLSTLGTRNANYLFYSAISDFGVYFSKSKMDSQSVWSIIHVIPQVINPSSNIITDTVQWTLVDGVFEANGGEKYLTIGDFNDNNHSHVYSLEGINSDAYYFIDDVSVTPVSYLSDTIRVCGKEGYWLHPRYQGLSYRWPDGSHVDSLWVTKTGIYPVVYDSNGFAMIDSISVVFPDLTLAMHDSVVCSGASYTVHLPPGHSYLWQNGTKADSMVIARPGTYWVQASDTWCTYTDTMHVRYDMPILLHLPSDTTICKGDIWTIRFDTGYYSLIWSDNKRTKTDSFTEAGPYSLLISNTCFQASAHFNINVADCPCRLYAPNAFTPNADGLNDGFRPVPSCPSEQYSLLIFNRWGEIVYQTDNPIEDSGWNGNFHGMPSPAGVYIWYAVYKPMGFPEIKNKGNMVLLR